MFLKNYLFYVDVNIFFLKMLKPLSLYYYSSIVNLYKSVCNMLGIHYSLNCDYCVGI